MGDAHGGWLLVLTCSCGHVEEHRGVVPTLAIESAEREGWRFTGRFGVDVVKRLTGRCGWCRRAGAA
jgi:hypothetical protein